MVQKDKVLKPMRIWDVADYSIEIFKNNFKTFVFISLILHIPWIFAKFLIDTPDVKEGFVSFLRYIEVTNSNSTDLLGAAGKSFVEDVFVLLNIIYSLTIKLVFHAAIMKVVYYYLVDDIYDFSYKNILKIIKNGFKYMWRMARYKVYFYIVLFGVFILSFIGGLFGFSFIASIVIPLEEILSADLTIILSVVITLIVGPVVIFFPVGVIWTKMILGYNFIVNEGLSVSESRKRAFRMSAGSSRHIGFSSLFCYIIYIIVVKMFTIISFYVYGVYENDIIFYILYSLGTVLSTILYPFVIVFITVLFIDIKVKKDGLDLEIKLNELIEKQENAINTNNGEV